MKCLICQSEANPAFDLPSKKVTGGSIDAMGDPVTYYKCVKCLFLFANHLTTYDDNEYWNVVEPVDDGRANQTVDLFIQAGGNPNKTVLDYGCGKGYGVMKFRELGYKGFGADIYPQRLEYYTTLDNATKKDIVVACEVVEHFTDPVASFTHACSLAEEAFAFQTAYQDGNVGRDWWYLGPANGHISLYSPQSLDIMREICGVKHSKIINDYPGTQAWFF